ncbi:MAG: diacylglycerol kinase family protein [Firmicutes bacterium]|nr:diacylglycerol kinase family protein [Bacillota bacterium]
MEVRRLLQSFRYAIEGVGYALRTQRNMRIHSAVAVVVVGLGYCLRLTRTEWVAIIFAVALVLVMEMVNTAIEKTIDLVTSKHHPLAKIAKNVAAGAVLVAAANAVVIGLLVFSPYLNEVRR